MATEIPVLKDSFPVAADLSSFQFCAVTLTTAGLLTTAATTATVVLGVLQNKPDNSIEKMGEVMLEGISKVKVDGTTDIAIGDALTPTTAGVGITTTTDNANLIGRALEAHADDSAAIISVLLKCGQRY